MKRLLSLLLLAASINSKISDINLNSSPERRSNAIFWQSLIAAGSCGINKLTEKFPDKARYLSVAAFLGISEYWFIDSQPEIKIKKAKKSGRAHV